ncbi:MAG: S8 family serine peptidase [Bacteroidota bacterium]
MRLFYTTIFTIATLLYFTTVLSAQDVNFEKVSLKLWEQMQNAPNDFHSINIVLADRVDLEALDMELRANKAKANERSAAVIRALREKAAATQGRLQQQLQSSPSVKSGTLRSSWIANAFFAEATNELIAALSQDATVEWIGLNGQLAYEETESTLPPPFLEPNGIEPGLAVINAPAMWAMGYTGYGQLALTSDTGIDPTHPALSHTYLGHYVPIEQTWFQVMEDGTPVGNYIPFDSGDHGTHVTGTTLGLDRLTNDTIGVAFNANWIGAQTLGSGIGTEDNVFAFEWALNPDGDSATADDMPDVVNNSWWDPSVSGEDCFSVYVPVMEALEVAGIAVIFSAGNQGDQISTITAPKNINLNEVNIFATGSVNGNSTMLTIAGSSSRGPSTCFASDSSLLIKPEVSAPGVSVRSCVPGSDYDFKSGTSMAAPHVSGSILLLKEAFPDLTAKDLKLALYHSARDLGVPGEDNTYGMGIIDVLAAFNYLVNLGHTPVSPHRANDVMLVHVFNPNFFCDNEVNPTITVENAGTDTLYSFRALYKVGTTQGEYIWNGMLAPRERAEVTLPPIAANSDQSVLSISVEEPNGVADERPLNNRFVTIVSTSDRPNFVATVEGPDNTACSNTSALLRGILPASMEGTGATMDIDWYTAAVGGTLLGNGEVFTTPLISQNETYYADVAFTVPTGPTDNSFSSSTLIDTTDIGLAFEVFYDLTLESVNIFKEETGGVIVRLIDSTGAAVLQDVEFSQTTGLMEVGLGWQLTPGKYQLILAGGKPIYYNPEGASYPYTLPGIMSITGATDSNDEAYYFFYNWRVTYNEPCGRSAVNVEVGPVGDAPAVDYSISADTVNIDDNELVAFTNSSTNTVEWYWNFGDGTTSNDENPTHSYDQPGIYVTSLTALNMDGCSGSAFYPIVVEKSNISSTPPPPVFDKIMVFPNPVINQLSVAIDLPVFKTVTLRLADSTGRIWEQAEYQGANGNLQMEVSTLPPGIYFLMVETDQGSSAWKVVKI